MVDIVNVVSKTSGDLILRFIDDLKTGGNDDVGDVGDVNISGDIGAGS